MQLLTFRNICILLIIFIKHVNFQNVIKKIDLLVVIIILILAFILFNFLKKAFDYFYFVNSPQEVTSQTTPEIS